MSQALQLRPPGLAAPEWHVGQWFNSGQPLTLAALRGRVVVLHAFQMLCPGCVLHGLPLAQKVADTFAPDEVAVIGLHTVFEHHAAMTPVSLRAFLHEYRVGYPVGVDQAQDSGLPRTMQDYGLRGTPSLLLIDRQGELRLHSFGQVPEMALGAAITELLREPARDLA